MVILVHELQWVCISTVATCYGYTIVCQHNDNLLTAETVPIVSITNETQEFLTLQDSNTLLQFTCMATGRPTPKLTWVRGGERMFIFPENDSRITPISFPLMLVLTINTSEANSSTLGSKEGTPYFCLANNVLGRARSQEVTIRYPSKFEKENHLPIANA